ncbi:hypothetical protein T10_8193 [Trichinella papuae]|uniref:Uncharacterized protein n=1 Tax=Trichinella papuae TaxID=268474 RepID=A0A0V1N212_9BILA|nr:hypothetical protein T10_8193 [Trichinella papuae]
MRSIRFQWLSSIFGCTVPALHPRHPLNDLQPVISNDSSSLSVTGIPSGLSNIKTHENYLEK